MSVQESRTFSALALLVLLLLCAPVQSHSETIPCNTQRIPVILARQFIERDRITAIVTTAAHLEWIPVIPPMPKCQFVTSGTDGYVLTYRYEWIHASEMKFLFDSLGNFKQVLHAGDEVAKDRTRYTEMQKWMTKQRDRLIDSAKPEQSPQNKKDELALFWFNLGASFLKQTAVAQEVADPRLYLDAVLSGFAAVPNYGSPPPAAIDQDHSYLSRNGFFFLQVTPPEAAAIMRQSFDHLDLREDMAKEREERKHIERLRYSSSPDLLIPADAITQVIPVVDFPASYTPSGDRTLYFLTAPLPEGYLQGDTLYGKTGFLMQLSDGRFGLVPAHDFDGNRMIPIETINAPIKRGSPPVLQHLSTDTFEPAMAQAFQQAAVAAHIDPSQYREDMEFLAEVVRTCATARATFARAALNSPAPTSRSPRWQPWTIVDPKYRQECAPGFLTAPPDRVKPVSKDKPRKLMFEITTSAGKWQESDHFTIAVSFTSLPEDVVAGALAALPVNYGILLAEIPEDNAH